MCWTCRRTLSTCARRNSNAHSCERLGRGPHDQRACRPDGPGGLGGPATSDGRRVAPADHPHPRHHRGRPAPVLPSPHHASRQGALWGRGAIQEREPAGLSPAEPGPPRSRANGRRGAERSRGTLGIPGSPARPLRSFAGLRDGGLERVSEIRGQCMLPPACRRRPPCPPALSGQHWPQASRACAIPAALGLPAAPGPACRPGVSGGATKALQVTAPVHSRPPSPSSSPCRSPWDHRIPNPLVCVRAD